MKAELDDILQHHGVKGMKWGKHKAQVVGDAVKSRVDSVKREHGLKRVLKNADSMSTKDIQKVNTRAQMENDMKRLSRERRVGSRKDKQDYLKRANMSDQELSRKVQRLRVKSNLKRNATEATKRQKDIAKKVIHIAAPLVLQYALTKSIGKKDVANAAVNAAVNLGGEKARLIKNLVDQSKNIKKVKHSGLDDILQHHGVKGMKWGHRKAQVKAQFHKAVKAHRQKQNKKVLDFHEKHKDKKTYKKLYTQNSQKLKTHLGAARKTRKQVLEIRNSKIKLASLVAVTIAANYMAHNPNAPAQMAKILSKGAGAVDKVIKNPDNIRRGKNIIQAIKGSKLRYADAKKMTNVVGTGAGSLMKI